MLITAGSTLLIPRSAKLQDDVAVHVADNAHMALSPEIVLKRTVVKAKKKDSVALLARRYNVTAANVAQWNKISATAALSNKQSVVLFLPMKTQVAGKAHGRANGKAVARSRSGSKSAGVHVAAKASPRKSKKS